MLNLSSYKENESKKNIHQIGKYLTSKDVVRIFGNKNFHVLLLGVNSATIITKSNLALSDKAEVYCILQPNKSSFLGIYPKETVTRQHIQRCSLQHSSQESTFGNNLKLINKEMDK